MKTVLLICFLIVLVSGLIFGGCTKPASAPAPAPALAPAPAPKPAASILLKFGTEIPETTGISKAWTWYFDEIEKQTGGKVKWDRYWGGSLIKRAAEKPDSLIAGVVDVTMINVMVTRKLLPVSHVFCLPSIIFPPEAQKDVRETFFSLMQKYPDLANEYKEFKPLTWSTDPVRIMVSDRPIHVPNDMAGLKIGGEGTGQDIIRAAGGVPVVIVPPETYISMQNGVINASLTIGWNHVQTYKLWEVAEYILDYGFGHGATNLYMNNKSWASLPLDVQKVMTDLMPELNTRCEQGLMATANAGKKSAIDNKCIVYVPTEAEIALWEKLKEPVEEEWLAEMKSKGINSAPDILKDVKQALTKAWGR